MYADDLIINDGKQTHTLEKPIIVPEGTLWHKNSIPMVVQLLSYEKTHPSTANHKFSKMCISEVHTQTAYPNLTYHGGLIGAVPEYTWLMGTFIPGFQLKGNNRVFALHSVGKAITKRTPNGKKTKTKIRYYFALNDSDKGYKLILLDKASYDKGIRKIIWQ